MVNLKNITSVELLLVQEDKYDKMMGDFFS